jgi:hypothetical protein
MVLEIAFAFLCGMFVGTFVGVISMALGVIAKHNVEDVPETPIVVSHERVPATNSY